MKKNTNSFVSWWWKQKTHNEGAPIFVVPQLAGPWCWLPHCPFSKITHVRIHKRVNMLMFMRIYNNNNNDDFCRSLFIIWFLVSDFLSFVSLQLQCCSFFFHSIESSFTDKVIETYNWETALDFKCMKKNIHIQIMMMMMAE